MIKNELRTICNLEADIYKAKLESDMSDTKAKLAKMKEKRKKIEGKIRYNTKCIKADNKRSIVTTGAIFIGITILIELFFLWLFVSAFGYIVEPIGATSIMTVVYTIIILPFVIYQGITEGELAKCFGIGIVVLGIMDVLTFGYFYLCEACLNLGSGGASILFMLLLILTEIGLTIYNWFEDDKNKMAYRRMLKIYQSDLKKLNYKISLMSKEINEKEEALRAKQIELRKLYSQSSLHPNYRNWVAAATIYEYLDVGICYELKGPQGAYSRYEQDLIAKKIVTSIDELEHKVMDTQKFIRSQLANMRR